MTKTICAFCSVSSGYNQDTAKYVADQWGVSLRAESEGEEILGIVVRDYPEIMSRVEEGYHFQTEPPIWQVNRISKEGVTFTWLITAVNPKMADTVCGKKS